MATNGGKIQFDVDFNVSKSGLNQIIKSLQEVQRAASTNRDNSIKTQFDEAAAAAKKLQQIVTGSWNDKLNQLNLNKFNQSIKASFSSVQNLKNQLVNGTVQGQAAFNSLANSVLNTNIQLKQSNTLLDSMATSMANTVKWGITSKIFNSITSSIQSAYYYVKDLDSALGDIRMVTGDSADEMERFAKNANDVSKSLGRSTLDYTKGAVEYYRQGLTDEQVAARTEITLKAQNITGAGSEMIDYLTAVWNGYKISTQEAEQAVDSLAKVADSSASDLSELATAMSKVAATANVVGVDFDELNAMIATVVATTRLAPESVGTAFKTIFARINDIKTGSDEAEISLGNYSGKMAELGINVLDASGRLRDTGDVINEVGQKWNTLTKEQQTYLASTMGGQRQITQVMALFDNWTTYVDLLNDSMSANGTLNEKNSIYLETVRAHLEQLGTEAERTYAILADTGAISGIVDVFNGALTTFNNFIEGIGGGATAFINLGSVIAGVFNKQIAQAIVNAKQRLDNFINTKNLEKFKQDYAQTFLKNTTGSVERDTTQQEAIYRRGKAQAQFYAENLKAQKGLTQEQRIELTNIQEQIGKYTQQLTLLKEKDSLLQQHGYYAGMTSSELDAELKGRQAVVNTLSQGLSLLQRCVISTDGLSDNSKQYALTWDQVKEKISESEQLTEQFGYLLEQDIKDNTQLKGIIEQITNKYNSQIDKVQQVARLKEIIIAYEKGEIPNLEKAIALQLNRGKAIREQGESVLKTQTFVKGLSAAGQTISAWAGALPTLLDQTATGAEKANAAFSGMQGSIMAIGTLFGPIGMGIASLANGLLSLLKNIIPGVDELFMSTQEKIEKLKSTINSINTETSSKMQTVSSLEGIVEEYTVLSEKAGDYGRTINRLTEEEKKRYYELTNEFASYNESVIVGYDEQGNAIVKNQDDLKETIRLMKEQIKLSAQQKINDQYGTTSNYIKEQQKILNQSQQQASLTVDNSIKNAYFNPLAGLSSVFGIQTDYNIDSFYSLMAKNKDKLLGTNQEKDALLASWQQEINELNAFWEGGVSVDQFQQGYERYRELLTQAFESTDTEQLQSIIEQFLAQANKAYQSWDHNIEAFDRAKKQAQSKLEQGLEFDTSFLTTVIKYGDEGYSDAYTKLTESDFYNHSIESLINEFIEGWTFNPDLIKNIESKQKQAKGYDQLLVFINEYIEGINKTLNQVGPAIQQALKENNITDGTDISGTVSKQIETITNIINTSILTNLDPSKFQDEEALQYLQDYLSNIFNAQIELAIDPETTNIVVTGVQKLPDKIITEAQAQVWEKFATTGHTSPKIQLPIDVEVIFNQAQLADIPGTLQKVWGDVENYIKSGVTDLNQALTLAMKDFHKREEELASLGQIDFKTAFTDFEGLTDALETHKELKDEQLEYLNLLEKHDGWLKKIALTEGRGSKAYLEALKQRRSLGQNLYLEEQKRIESAAREELAALDINATEEERIRLENIIADALYNQAMAEEAIKNAQDQVLKKEQELLKIEKERNQGKISSIQNTNSTISNLKNNSLAKEDYSTLHEWESRDAELAELAGEDGAGRYTRAYINRLSKLSVEQDTVLDELYQNAINIAQQNMSALEVSLEEINKKLVDSGVSVTAQQYEQAKKAIEQLQNDDSGAKGVEAALQANQKIITAYETQIELRRQQAELEQSILNEQVEIDFVKGQQIQHQRELNGLYQERLNTLNSLVNREDLNPEQAAQLSQLLSQLTSQYPELESAARTLNDTWLVGTDRYKEALEQVRSKLSELNQQELSNQLNNKLEEIEIDFELQNWEELKNDIEDFCDIDRDILISVKTEADQEFEELNSYLDELYSAASKIGSGFKVAVDDIYEVASAFPGILENYQVLADGSIQLTQEAVQAAIAGAQQEAQAEKDSVIQRLQAQSQLARSKAEKYYAAAEAAYALAGQEENAEGMAAGTRQAIFAGLMQMKEDSAATQAQNESNIIADAAQEEATNVGEAAQNMADNMAESANSQADNMATAAEDITINQGEIAKGSDQSARIVADNYASSASSMANSVAQAAQSIIRNLAAIASASKSALSGKAVSAAVSSGLNAVSTYGGSAGSVSVNIKKSTIQSSYSGTSANISSNLSSKPGKGDYSGTSGEDQRRQQLDMRNGRNPEESSLAKQFQEILDKGKEELIKLGDQFKDAGDAWTKTAEGIEAQIAALEAKSAQTQNELGKAASGRPSAGKGGGGGGGGGGGSEEQPEVMQLLDEQYDIYHNINQELKRLANNFDKVAKKQSKLFGKELIDNLNEQLQILEDQISATQHKLELTQRERSQLQQTLAAQGTSFDSNGYISNYNQMMTNKINMVNSTIEYYNTLTKAEQETYKEQVDRVKADYEEFKATVERYDELISEEIPKLQSEIQDKIDKQFEIRIEHFKIRVELELDMSKFERDFNNFRKKVIDKIKDDNILGNAGVLLQDLSSYYTSGTGIGAVGALTEQVNKTLGQLYQMDATGTSDVYGDNRAQAMQDLKNYTEQLMETLGDVEDVVDEIEESIFDAIDEAQDAFDKQLDTYDHVSSLIDHDIKVIKLLYGDDAYEALNKYYEMQRQNDNAELDFLRQQKEMWYNRMQLEQQRMNEAEMESNEWKTAQKRFDEYKQHWMDTTKELNSTVESAIQNIIEKYNNAIDQTFDNLEKKILNGKTLEQANEEWELMNKQSDLYFDNVNRLYELEKIEDAFKAAINDNKDNVKAQQSLNLLMEEELGYLKEKEHLTQYDVDRANLLLQIEMKRLALENSRQTKSKLRLRRDRQGNYTYQYVADTTEIDNTRQELSTLQNQLYNLTKDNYLNITEDLAKTFAEWENKITQIYKKGEEYVKTHQEEIAFYNKYYGDIITEQTKQQEAAKKYLQGDTFSSLYLAYQNNETEYSTMTEKEKEALNDWATHATNKYGQDQIALGNMITAEGDLYNGLMADNKAGYDDFSEHGKGKYNELSEHGKGKYNELSEYEKKILDENMIPQWSSGLQDMADNFYQDGQGDGFINICKSGMDELDNVTTDYQKDVEAMEKAAGKNFEDLKNEGIDPDITATEKLVEDNDNLIDKYGGPDGLIAQVDGLIDSMRALVDAYVAQTNAAIDAATQAYNYVQQVSALASQIAALPLEKTVKIKYEEEYVEAPEYTPPEVSYDGGGESYDGSGGGGDYSGGGGGGGGNYSAPSYTYYVRGRNESGTYVRLGPLSAAQVNNLPTTGWKAGAGQIEISRIEDGARRYVSPGGVYAFKSGGYTGEWSDGSGKLAVLHQKELVLNETDTKNILETVNVVRTLKDLLDNLNMEIQPSVLNQSFFNTGSTSDTLDQNVHITAEFPNVTDHTEIERALESLVNRATQYAFRQ